MASTYQRSLLKGVMWEGISLLITMLIYYALFGNIGNSIKFSVILTAIKVPFFFAHERAWKKVKWGKI